MSLTVLSYSLPHYLSSPEKRIWFVILWRDIFNISIEIISGPCGCYAATENCREYTFKPYSFKVLLYSRSQMGMDRSGIKEPEFKSCPCHFLTLWLWTSFVAFTLLNFFICKMMQLNQMISKSPFSCKYVFLWRKRHIIMRWSKTRSMISLVREPPSYNEEQFHFWHLKS